MQRFKGNFKDSGLLSKSNGQQQKHLNWEMACSSYIYNPLPWFFSERQVQKVGRGKSVKKLLQKPLVVWTAVRVEADRSRLIQGMFQRYSLQDLGIPYLGLS